MAASSLVYDSRHLQVDCQNRDQLWNPMLGNRVWATFTVFYIARNIIMIPRRTATTETSKKRRLVINHVTSQAIDAESEKGINSAVLCSL